MPHIVDCRLDNTVRPAGTEGLGVVGMTAPSQRRATLQRRLSRGDSTLARKTTLDTQPGKAEAIADVSSSGADCPVPVEESGLGDRESSASAGSSQADSKPEETAGRAASCNSHKLSNFGGSSANAESAPSETQDASSLQPSLLQSLKAFVLRGTPVSGGNSSIGEPETPQLSGEEACQDEGNTAEAGSPASSTLADNEEAAQQGDSWRPWSVSPLASPRIQGHGGQLITMEGNQAASVSGMITPERPHSPPMERGSPERSRGSRLQALKQRQQRRNSTSRSPAGAVPFSPGLLFLILLLPS